MFKDPHDQCTWIDLGTLRVPNRILCVQGAAPRKGEEMRQGATTTGEERFPGEHSGAGGGLDGKAEIEEHG